MKIFLIGWFGAGNIGDEAILISELLFLREQIKKVEFYILSFDPGRTRRLTAEIPEVKRILRMGSKQDVVKSDFREIWKTFREVDVVLIGGGGIFQDIYNHYPIPFFTTMALLARLHRKQLVLYCVGIGPIRTFLGKKLCRLAGNAADMILVRDSGSMDLLRELGVTRETFLAADPVFFLQPLHNERVEKIIAAYNLRSPEPVIGVSVQDLLFWSDTGRKTLASALEFLRAEKRAKIVFLPLGAYRDSWFKKGEPETVDIASSRRLAGLMKGKHPIITEELRPQELLAVMQEMDLIISMRLHGLIMGVTAGVPVIALTYREESKIRNLMKRLGQEESLFIVNELEIEELLERAKCLLSETQLGAKCGERYIPTLRADMELANRRWLAMLPDEGIA